MTAAPRGEVLAFYREVIQGRGIGFLEMEGLQARFPVCHCRK